MVKLGEVVNAGHEQAAQIAIPPFADTAEPIPTPESQLLGLDRAGSQTALERIISLAPSHHCPGHSGELVGKRDGGDFGRPSCQQRCDPGPILGAVIWVCRKSATRCAWAAA